jgi:CRP-like cAMP-binding protein
VAAEVFRRLGDELRSAQCLSLAGLNEEAADLFMRCGQPVLAAQHLEKARAWEQAASIYQKGDLFLEAARCHEKDDEPVKAAALFLKARKPDLALPLLQSVPPAHKQFAQCRLLAAKILFQKGQRDLAMTLLRPLLGTEIKGDDELETFYQLAVLLEQGGEVERAREIYLGIQRTRFDFKDVTSRIEALAKTAEATILSPILAPPPAQEKASESAVDLGPLRDCSIFHRMDLEDLRRLWVIGRAVACRAGEVLLAAGQHSGGLYVVLAGGLTITPDPSNPGLAAGFLGPGDYVGLGSLVKGPPQPNALVAQAGTRLLLLPIPELESLFSAEPELGLRFFRSIAEHLTQTLAAGGVKK